MSAVGYTGDMVYLALLRGVNVGGKAMVSMAALKDCFETLGFTHVTTFINSGNLLFQSTEKQQEKLTRAIEAALQTSFNIPIQILLKTHDQLMSIADAIPDDWVNDDATKCDIMFLWPEIDNPKILEQLPSNPGIEETRYEPGAVLWHINRTLVTKSRMTRIVGTKLYHQMTIRNVNTVRKLAALAKNYD